MAKSICAYRQSHFIEQFEVLLKRTLYSLHAVLILKNIFFSSENMQSYVHHFKKIKKKKKKNYHLQQKILFTDLLREKAGSSNFAEDKTYKLSTQKV